MSDPVEQERRRCVGIVLQRVGELRAAGFKEEAQRLDDLALRMEKREEYQRYQSRALLGLSRLG